MLADLLRLRRRVEPKDLTCPNEGRTAVARTRRSVVLPDPLCPVRSTAAPRLTAIDSRKSAHRAP